MAEFSSLAEAGTLRYMAPELLEGAVNLKDCENALKEADVYALSLVLWETSNTCSKFQIDENHAPYFMAYEKEIGERMGVFYVLCPESEIRINISLND